LLTTIFWALESQILATYSQLGETYYASSTSLGVATMLLLAISSFQELATLPWPSKQCDKSAVALMMSVSL
jgi:hypothetical protein